MRCAARALCRRRAAALCAIAVRRYGTAHDNVDDVLDEIMDMPDEAATTSRGEVSDVRTSDMPQGAAPRLVATTVTENEAAQDMLAAAAEEREVLCEELLDMQRKQARSVFAPQPAAKTYLSAAELIADGAAQQFCASRSAPATLPHLRACGSTAVVSLVGIVHGNLRLCQTTPSHSVESANTVDAAALTAQSEYDEFVVKYTAPFDALPTQSVTVRCYGATLRTYVRANVKQGDVVHVLGQLALQSISPLGNGAHVSIVYVMPVGGNIIVVLQSAQ